jgi:type VI secretion system protein ImpL
MEGIKKGEPAMVKDYAVGVLQGKVKLPEAMSTIRGSLRKFDQTLRDAVSGLFEGPVLAAWAGVAADAQRYLNLQWNNRIVEVFGTTLGPYYPFNPAGKDAPMADVLAFFDEPDGTFWTFFKDELEPFVRKDVWQPQSWEGVGIALSEDMRSSLKQAKILGKGLKGGLIELEFEIKPQPPTRLSLSAQAPVLERICLVIDGQESWYQMGNPRWSTVKIPGREGPRGANLEIFGTEGRIDGKRFDGDWGWFRLVKQAHQRVLSRSEYELEWTFSGGGKYQIIVRYTVRTRTGTNPFATTLSEFRCPRQLN